MNQDTNQFQYRQSCFPRTSLIEIIHGEEQEIKSFKNFVFYYGLAIAPIFLVMRQPILALCTCAIALLGGILESQLNKNQAFRFTLEERKAESILAKPTTCETASRTQHPSPTANLTTGC